MSRRYAAEFLGTFAIVFFGCGSIISLGSSQPLGINLVFGLTVGVMVYALGHLSAAHFNPAVTLGFAAARRFPWRFVPGYLIAQIGGGLAATSLHLAILGGRAGFGATVSTLDPARAVLLEGILTFFLMLVIMSVATDKRTNGAVTGLAIGGWVALAGLFAGPLTGCSMNPARSLAPALFAQGLALESLWIFLVGPVVGAVCGALVYEAIRGGEHHAQGAPNDLALALEQIGDL